MSLLKQSIERLLGAPGAKSAFRSYRRGVGTIFMLHRFNDPVTGATGDDPQALRAALAFLRRRGYELVALEEMFKRLREGHEHSDLGVAFTLDDGYADQVRIAGPVFAEFDCPATVFVTTGFVDRTFWQWWDRIEYIFDNTPVREANVMVADTAVELRWENGLEREAVREEFIGRCKLVSDADKHAAIDNLARAAAVEMPEMAPPRYEPMTWTEMRSWEGRGMSFGPHTVNHPILAQTTDEESRLELVGSWERMREMAQHPVPVFCYPNGQPGDFGPREVRTLMELGLEGAVVGSPGYADLLEFRERPENPFLVRRFSYPKESYAVARFVTGAERALHGTGGPS